MHERQEEMHKHQVGIEDLFKKFVNQVFDRIEGIEARISQGLGTVGQPVAHVYTRSCRPNPPGHLCPRTQWGKPGCCPGP